MTQSSIARLERLNDNLNKEIESITREINNIPADEVGNFDALTRRKAKLTFKVKLIQSYFEQ